MEPVRGEGEERGGVLVAHHTVMNLEENDRETEREERNLLKIKKHEMSLLNINQRAFPWKSLDDLNNRFILNNIMLYLQ